MALPSAPKLTPTGAVYSAFSKEVIYIVPTIANPAAPTLAEFNAGKDVSLQVQAVNGFATAVASLDVPRLGTNFTGNIGGRETADASSIVFYASDAGPTDDVRSQASLLQNAKGFVVIFNEGVVTSGSCDIWPYRVGSVSVAQDVEAVKLITVNFNIYTAPSRNIAIPTA